MSELILLVVLKGAFVFAADLGRAISRLGGLEFRYEFIRTSAYGHTIKQQNEDAREVSVARLPADLAGKDVLLVEDLIDQGYTLTTLKQRVLKCRRPLGPHLRPAIETPQTTLAGGGAQSCILVSRLRRL